MAKENTLWTWLAKARRSLIGLDMERVENSVATGTPDVDGHYNKRSFKIELKRAQRPRQSETITIKWQKRQQPWLKRRWNAGGLAWLLIAVGEGSNIRRYLIRGSDVENLGPTELSGKALVQKTTEAVLEEFSLIHPRACAADIILTASSLYFG